MYKKNKRKYTKVEYKGSVAMNINTDYRKSLYKWNTDAYPNFPFQNK